MTVWQQAFSQYQTLADSQRHPVILGMYLVGSIALGEFRNNKSDIDAVWLLENEPTRDEIELLANRHLELASHAPPYLDGVYVTLHRLKTPAADGLPIPFVVNGVFSGDKPCGDLNPILRQCLIEHGMTIFGAQPSTLGIVTDRTSTDSWIRSNLRGYWRSWMAEAKATIDARRPDQGLSAAALSWGVLGVSRMAATLETGEIIGKSAAGEWAMRRWPEWAPVLLPALDERAGHLKHATINQGREALAYMDYIVTRFS